MRVGILLNDRIALPALHYLAGTGQVVGIGLPCQNSETAALVKKICAEASIPLAFFTKQNLERELADWIDRVEPEVVVVKTFPFRFPASVFTRPRFGFINFHYAPLPEWRGANPLFWMLRNRVRQGGISVHQVSADYDAGPILAEAMLPIPEGTTFGLLNTQLAFLGLRLTQQLLPNLEIAFQQTKPQAGERAKWYGRPRSQDLFIDWQQMEAEDVLALVNACNPWNKGAGVRWKGWIFGITWASLWPQVAVPSSLPGTNDSLDERTGLLIACKGGTIIKAEIVYCEEGFYPGNYLLAFGLKNGDRLSS